MIETFSNGQAKDLEAEIEYPLHLKIQQAEAYLTKKYPTTKIHFFTNILRKQRAGQHTPFLVSPEGSKAYALMLNDFLLNPAAMICGITPMPFDLPKNFKILSSIGVFPEAEWTLKQNLAAEYRKKIKLLKMIQVKYRLIRMLLKRTKYWRKRKNHSSWESYQTGVK